MSSTQNPPENGQFRKNIHALILTAKRSGAQDVYLLRQSTQTRLHFVLNNPMEVEQMAFEMHIKVLTFDTHKSVERLVCL